MFRKLTNHQVLLDVGLSIDGCCSFFSISFRPVADMAELTPDAWGVVTDRYGGLRVLADMINWRISLLYRYTFATTTNIVAMDFYRGTTIINLAMELNRRLNERNSEVQST